eukprot:m.19656 g.19656  ORF g.19656 m.19656 type:complete len:304 (-) comp10940_c0_seq1:216-1127(-)
MSLPTVAIVTGNSNSGSAALNDLLTRYNGTVKVRAAFRSQSKAAPFIEKHSSNVNFHPVVGVDASNKASLGPAFEGVTMAMIVTPHDPSQGMANDHALSNAMIEAAVEAGVQYIVYVGSWTVHAPEDIKIISARFEPTERYLNELSTAGKVQFTSLRSGFFNNNLIALFGQAKTSNAVAFPNLTIPVVDPADMGHVAAALFASDNQQLHYGKAYDISGPEPLTIKEMVAKVAQARGQPIDYTDTAVSSLTYLPEFLLQVFQYIDKVGATAVPCDDVTKRLTGYQTSFEEWLESNYQTFLPASS